MYEWRKDPIRKGPPILSMEDIPNTNFRSVYQYGTEAVKYIQENKSIAGVGKFSVSSYALYIDVDKDNAVDEVEGILKSNGWEFSKWDTGNRGAHFHVRIVPMRGVEVPHSQHIFIESLGISNLVDTTIYRHHSIFRKPGAVHSKTEESKVLIKTVPGTVLNIPLVKKPEPKVFKNHDIGTPEAYRRFKRNLTQKRGPGQRHQHLYILFQSGIEAGLKSDEILLWMQWWNDTQQEKHSEEQIRTKWLSFNRQYLNGSKT